MMLRMPTPPVEWLGAGTASFLGANAPTGAAPSPSANEPRLPPGKL